MPRSGLEDCGGWWVGVESDFSVKCTKQMLEFGTKIWEEHTNRTVYRVASQLKISNKKLIHHP